MLLGGVVQWFLCVTSEVIWKDGWTICCFDLFGNITCCLHVVNTACSFSCKNYFYFRKCNPTAQHLSHGVLHCCWCLGFSILLIFLSVSISPSCPFPLWIPSSLHLAGCMSSSASLLGGHIALVTCPPTFSQLPYQCHSATTAMFLVFVDQLGFQTFKVLCWTLSLSDTFVPLVGRSSTEHINISVFLLTHFNFTNILRSLWCFRDAQMMFCSWPRCRFTLCSPSLQLSGIPLPVLEYFLADKSSFKMSCDAERNA